MEILPKEQPMKKKQSIKSRCDESEGMKEADNSCMILEMMGKMPKMMHKKKAAKKKVMKMKKGN